jgi:DNA-binding beta-propeller fold protein YncE
VATVGVGKNPVGVGVNPNTNYIYVTNFGAARYR